MLSANPAAKLEAAAIDKAENAAQSSKSIKATLKLSAWAPNSPASRLTDFGRTSSKFAIPSRKKNKR